MQLLDRNAPTVWGVILLAAFLGSFVRLCRVQSELREGKAALERLCQEQTQLTDERSALQTRLAAARSDAAVAALARERLGLVGHGESEELSPEHTEEQNTNMP